MVHREMLIGGHFVGGVCDQAVGKQVVRAPYDGAVVGTAAEGTSADLKVALDAAHEAFEAWRFASRHERQGLLRRIAALVREREEELVDILTREVGKPVVWSRGEVGRLALTFDYAADLMTSWGVEALPVDMDPRGEGHRCVVERFPIGVILCIVPYNWPYNLAAHKIAPALATGNTVLLKPSHQAPLSTLSLVRLIHEAGCPPGVVNAWNGSSSHVKEVQQDPRIRMLSFTGSPKVGWMLKEQLHDRRVSLELGGNATAVVAEDADLEWAAKRIVLGSYGYAGQICIAIQHVLAHESLYDELRERLIVGTRQCPYGDPEREETVCGPLIEDAAAEKVEAFVREAVEAGAKVLAGGERQGRLYPPTLVEGVPEGTRLSCEEVFGPVVTLDRYGTPEEAIGRINASPYGIHAGVFTRDLRLAERFFRELEVGGVIVNDYPTLRFDNMPYGGVKRSGFGREGLRYAMEEMTEPKTMVVKMR
jgi:acyl-CoA reductase-like NAD-dependent aldehyde dehydrogenase